MRQRWTVRLVIVVLVAAGCSNSGTKGPSAKAPSGPILTVLTAATVDPTGQPNGLSQSFAPTQPQVTALVVLGTLGGASDLAVTWSRVTPEGPKPLFTHHITVADFDRAASTALSPGTLAVGAYQVSASIGNATMATVWQVLAPGNATAPPPA